MQDWAPFPCIALAASMGIPAVAGGRRAVFCSFGGLPDAVRNSWRPVRWVFLLIHLRGVDMPVPESSAVAGHPTRAFDHIVTLLRSAGCVFAEEEARLLLAEASGPAELARNVRRRVEGVPLEYVLGWAEFAGRRIGVEAGVFVPRRRTELLANHAVALLSGWSVAEPPVVVDLCCGSGAVGAAILYALPGVELHAADIDATATRCAMRNIGPLGGRVHRGDLFEALPSSLHGRVGLLAVNAPMCPPGPSGPCRPRPGSTSLWPRWTAARTGWTSTDALPPAPSSGSHPEDTC